MKPGETSEANKDLLEASCDIQPSIQPPNQPPISHSLGIVASIMEVWEVTPELTTLYAHSQVN